MTRMSNGTRSGSRSKLTKKIKQRGMPKVNSLLKKFEIGETVAVVIDPAIQKGMPFHNFQGRTGKITGMQGNCYILKIKIGNTERKIISAPVHLKRLTQ
ncbi:MAG: 50S ribosomal protein L21e [Candidatus Thermoplasmatota archaeon]|jgi:large subunit ribosomal protein L21e|nr:50S ribosomal protein L21e [Candidatus Thermoplasmatota archaeon]HII82528.1 50S ribosomal protein L21e [Ferroplasma sp.]